MSPYDRFLKLDPALRDRVLEVASLEFAEHGFHGASYNRIIASTGLSKGRFYYYFENRTDLFLTVVEEAWRRVSGRLDGPAAAMLRGEMPSRHFWRRCEELSWALWRELLADDVAWRLIKAFYSIGPSPMAEPDLARLDAATRAWMTGLLQHGQAMGAVRTDLPVELLAGVALGMGQAMDRWALSAMPEPADMGDPAELRRFNRSLVDLFEDALSPRERP